MAVPVCTTISNPVDITKGFRQPRCSCLRQSGLLRRVVVRSSQLETADGGDGAAPTRQIICSDLYNMVAATQQAQDSLSSSTSSTAANTSPAADLPAQPVTSSSNPANEQVQASQTSTHQQQQQQQQQQQLGSTGYYQGLLTSELQQDNGASAGDMLRRNLQLAAGVAGALGLLLLGFMASNGLL